MISQRLRRMSRAWSRGSKAAVALLALVTGTGSLNETEIICEEAIAHINDCCPELLVDNICGDAPGSCSPVTTLSQAESDCIRELSCGADADAVCMRLQALSDAVAAGETIPEQAVCP